MGQPYLEIVEGLDVGKRVDLLGEALTIGRSPANAFCLPDGRASRQHAAVRPDRGHYSIEDLNSANGTFINGNRLQPGLPVLLEPEDEILISATKIRYRNPSAKPKTATPSILVGGGDEGYLSVVMQGEEAGAPAVNCTLDASMSMLDLREEERASEKGMLEAVKRLQTMVRVSSELGTVTSRDAILRKVMDNILDIFPSADRAFVMLRDKKSGEMVPTLARHRVARPGQADEFAVSRTILRQVTEQKQSVLSSDAQRDDRFGLQQSIVNLSIRSMMCVPLLAQEEILGVLNVDTISGLQAFSADDLAVLTGIAAQAAGALKNAELHESVRVESEKRNHLARYMSPDVVQGVMSGRIPLELGGKRARGTVFFCDIIGFTSMSERMEPLEVVTVLNRHMRGATDAVIRNKGTLHKFGGDMIMAFWNVMFPDPSPELHALRCGLEMQAGVFAFDLELAAEGKSPILTGIGLNTGEFIAGNIGGDERFEYTVIGDHVNLAQRVESLAGRWQVLASADTFAAARETCIAVELPPVTVKGKSAAIRIYSVRGAAEEDGLSLLLPVGFPDEGPAGSARGLLTSATCAADGLHLTLCTGEPVAAGTTIDLAIRLPELAAPLPLPVRILSVAETKVEGKVAARNAVCLPHDAPAETLALFRPGTVLKGDRSWEEMKRK